MYNHLYMDPELAYDPENIVTGFMPENKMIVYVLCIPSLCSLNIWSPQNNIYGKSHCEKSKKIIFGIVK